MLHQAASFTGLPCQADGAFIWLRWIHTSQLVPGIDECPCLLSIWPVAGIRQQACSARSSWLDGHQAVMSHVHQRGIYIVMAQPSC